MERLGINEVIEHCERTVARYERTATREYYETTDIGKYFSKEYWEHRQVAELLKQLKAYKDAEEQGLLLRLPDEMRGLDKTIVNLAIVKAINLAKYGVDIDRQIKTATEMSLILQDAYIRGRQYEIDRMNKIREEDEAALGKMKGGAE